MHPLSNPKFFASLIALLLIAVGQVSYAQVGKIKDNARSNRSSGWSSSSDSGDYDDDSGCADACGGFIAEVMFFAIVASQQAVLETRDEYPERVSLEWHGTLGDNMVGQAQLFNTGIKGNWGIFSTDFKFQYLYETLDDLSIYDWTVLMVRIPIGPVKFEYGVGNIHVYELNFDYFKQHIGIDVRFPNSKVTAASSYHWTDGDFRESFNARLDYQLFQANSFRLSPMISYTYQKYPGPESAIFKMLSLGVMMRVF